MEKERENKVKSFRILQIDDEIRRGSYPNVPYFMKKFEASRSTIMRDIAFLQDRYNAPLEYDPVKKGYYYSDPTFFIKSMMLSEGELFTVTTILPLLEQYKNTPLEASFKNIISKMMDLLPEQVKVDSDFNSSEVTYLKDPLPVIAEETFNAIFKATKTKKTMHFGYRSIKNQEYTTRMFDPYNVLCQKGNWYVIGYCHKHNDIMVYALSRMNNAIVTDQTFSIKPDYNLNQHIDPDLGIWNNKQPPVKIELIFSPKINTYILERVWHANQQCHQNDDGSVYLSFTSNQIQETLYWVLHFGSAVKVLNPPELKKMVENEVKKILENIQN